ncbi:MAG: EamA family transporter [Haloplanus sp.]
MLSGAVLAAISMSLTGGYLVAYKRYFAGYPTFLYLGLVEGAALCWYVAIGVATGRSVVTFPAGFDAVAVALLGGVVAVTVGSAVASVRALQIGDVSYVAPLSKLAPPVVLLIEAVGLGTRVSPSQMAGLCAVTIGVYLLEGTEPGETAGVIGPFRRLTDSTPARLALASAVLIGVADVGKRVLLANATVAPSTLVAVTLAGLTIGTLPIGLRRWKARPTRRTAWVGLAAAGLVLATADHLTALALATTPASVVVPILSGQALVAVVLGGRLLGETATRRRLVATASTSLGIVLVVLG